MNSLPGVADMLALLDALKKNVRDFAAREEKLEKRRGGLDSKKKTK